MCFARPNEISKEDDLFDSFEADIDLEEDDSDLDGHSDVNEDDLLMELDEMINQWERVVGFTCWRMLLQEKECRRWSLNEVGSNMKVAL